MGDCKDFNQCRHGLASHAQFSKLHTIRQLYISPRAVLACRKFLTAY